MRATGSPLYEGLVTFKRTKRPLTVGSMRCVVVPADENVDALYEYLIGGAS